MPNHLLTTIQNLLLRAGMAAFVFFLLFTTSGRLIQASCSPYGPVSGCAASTPNRCTTDNTICCTTVAECSFPTPPSGCDPGSGFIPLGDCLKLSDDTKVSDTYTTPAFLVNLLVRNIFVAAGVVLFFMILLAGFQFLAGGKKGAENAKQIATATAVGFALMFSAYWIVQIVKLLTKTNIIL
ncbi:hypothetical protein KC921_00700 [Candidatus Woesebacteria bacterium]|nr:hypothetical protein [Candidatus Woesebacteria bacterium]